MVCVVDFKFLLSEEIDKKSFAVLSKQRMNGIFYIKYEVVLVKEFQSVRPHPAMVESTVTITMDQLCSICPTGT